MQKINLLYVITKLELGGAQKHLLSLISLLDKERFNVFLFTAGQGLLLQDALSIEGLTVEKSKSLERPMNPFRDLLAFIEIFRFIKKHRIDIVHTHSSKAGILGRLAARFAGVKAVIHTIHGWSFNDFQPPQVRRLYIWLERLAAQFTQKLIAVSECDKRKGLFLKIGCEEKYMVIRYGIDFSVFRAQQFSYVRGEFGIGPSELVVGMISCLKPQKSAQDFVRLANLTLKEMPDVKFILAGDGILRDKVEEMIDNFGIRKNIFLAGWRRDIPAVLGALDVFVLTSLWEGLPISVLEAMAQSKPVIATNTGGVSEVLKEGETGFLVAPGDILGMSRKLVILLRDEALRKRTGIGANNSLGNSFTLSYMGESTRSLYNDLMS